jgi:hypothetical protein
MTTYNSKHTSSKQNGWMKKLHDPKQSKEYINSTTFYFVDKSSHYNHLLDEL